MNSKLQAPTVLARRALAAVVLCSLAGLAGAQTTWYVDDDHPGDPTPGVSGLGFPFSNPNETGSSASPFDDIQKAINVAANGDTVLVRPSNHFGYYSLSTTFGQVNFLGKTITVKSTGGPLVTAIDGSLIPGSSGIVIGSGSGAATVLEGFTIQNCDRGSATTASGGGLHVSSASPTIRDCRFVSNHAYVGGGAFTTASAARFEDCVFLNNAVGHQGGGVYGAAGSTDFLRCTFDSNTADFGGGALFRTNAADLVEIVECLFVSNDSLNYGGGMAKFDQGDLDVVRTRFVGNVAAARGGAAQVHGGGQFRECIFNANTASLGTVNTDDGGSGAPGSVTVSGSTFTQNVGGAGTESAGALTLHNCISWNNLPFELGAGVAATYSDVLGGWPGTGNIDADPRFQDAFGADNLLGTLDDDLALTRFSPCIDAGDSLQLGGAAFPIDLAGNRRAADDPRRPDTGRASLWVTTDMGAFEYQSPTGGFGAVEYQP